MINLLQTGSQINIELLLIVGITALQVFAVVAFIVYDDAKSRNSNHPIAWGVAAFFGNIVVWILYFVVREELGSDSAATTEQM